MPRELKRHSQGVVSIWSPVKMALAPAMKHIACSASLSVCRPAARRMIVDGITMRAVEIVRRSVWYGTGWTAKTRQSGITRPSTSFAPDYSPLAYQELGLGCC